MISEILSPFLSSTKPVLNGHNPGFGGSIITKRANTKTRLLRATFLNQQSANIHAGTRQKWNKCKWCPGTTGDARRRSRWCGKGEGFMFWIQGKSDWRRRAPPRS